MPRLGGATRCATALLYFSKRGYLRGPGSVHGFLPATMPTDYPLHPADPGQGPLLPERVLHTMPWGVLALDRPGVVRLLNPYAARLLGRPAAEVLGQPLAQVVPAGFPAALLQLLHAGLTAPSPVGGEFYLPYCQQWIEVTTDPGAEEVLVYWQDVTRTVAKRQQYQALADHTPDALGRWDTSLRLCYANPALEATAGQILPRLLGKTPDEIGTIPFFNDSFQARLHEVLTTGQPQRSFNTFRTPQGTQYYQTSLVPELHDGRIQTVLSITHDVTELKQAELAAAAQAHFSEQLATTSPDRIQVRALATNQLLYVNRAGQPELGYNPEQVLAAHARGEAPFPGAPPDEAALTAYWASFATAEPEQVLAVEHQLQALDGSWHWYRMRGKVFAHDAQGRPTQALSLTSCITAEKQAEANLRAANDLLEAVFNATRNSLEVLACVRNGAGEIVDFTWVLTNEAAHQLAQRTDLVGRRLLAEEPPMLASGVFDRLRQVVAQQQPADFEQYYPHGGNGEWFYIVAAPFGDGVVVNWHDITARKQASAKLLRLQVAQQQQLANAVLDAQETERRRIAESLHNGLGQLLYATKLHLEAVVLPQEHPTLLKSKRKTEQLLATAIAQVRTISHQLVPIVLHDFGLAAALRDLCQTMRTSGLHLHCTVGELAPLPPPLALALYRMAQELASNLSQHAGATRAELSLTEQAGWLELRVADNGRGFDLAQAPQGLGLRALRDRTQLLNGELAITSAPGQGTQAVVRVPRTALPG
jgi:two-component system NarL family sensor kinase